MMFYPKFWFCLHFLKKSIDALEYICAVVKIAQRKTIQFFFFNLWVRIKYSKEPFYKCLIFICETT